MVNPQYHIRVHGTTTSADKYSPSTSTKAKAEVTLTAYSARDISLNIIAVWSHGERIAEYVLFLFFLLGVFSFLGIR